MLTDIAARARAILLALRRQLGRRIDDTSGSVSVDWVVLSAAVIGLGVGIIAVLLTGTNAVGTQTGKTLSEATIKDIAFD